MVAKDKKKGKKENKNKNEPPPVENQPEDGDGVEEAPPFKLSATTVPLESVNIVRLDPVQLEPIDLKFIENERDMIKLICESITAFTNQRIDSMHNECIKNEMVNFIENMGKTDQDGNEDESKKKKKPVKVVKPRLGNLIPDPNDSNLIHVLPIWTPPTPRAHASLLYLYFRKVTKKSPPNFSFYLKFFIKFHSVLVIEFLFAIGSARS